MKILKRKKENRTVLFLDNIRSVHNVGSIFRTADAAGASLVILNGLTPTPIDRFGRKRKDFAKAALGAEDSVEWKHSDKAIGILSELKKEGYFIVGVEQTSFSENYRKVKVKKGKRVFVFGNEVSGISKIVLGKCDVVVEIPMLGKKESLNVSVATGIILFHFLEN